jgi:hypothetical protein
LADVPRLIDQLAGVAARGVDQDEHAPRRQVIRGVRGDLLELALRDGGERTLCLIVPGAAQCGDRGTVRQVYLHDGWAATMHCPR